MILGLREVLRLYGGNRGIPEPANALMARVTGIFGPLIIVAFGFSDALDVEAFRASAAPSDVECIAGVPSGVWINVALSGVAVVLIALIPVILRRRRESDTTAAMIGHATFVFTVAVAVWTGAIVPFLPTDVVSGAILEHIVVEINLVGAVAFGAAAWVSRAAPEATEA